MDGETKVHINAVQLMPKSSLPNASITGLESNTLFSIFSTDTLPLGVTDEAATVA